MKTNNKLDCYLWSNLIVSILSFSFLVNPVEKELIMLKDGDNNTLRPIYIIDSVEDNNDIITNNPIEIVVSAKNVYSSNTFNYIKPSYNSLTGSVLVNYAKHYVGLRYVSAGNSLVTGTDCSGFTKLIYQEFGISLGRTVTSQLYNGTYVAKSDLQPGDLVFYSYGNVPTHVAIYIGNGLIIHASNPRDGVKISTVNIMNYITARRLITANVISTLDIAEKNSSKEENKEEVISDSKIDIQNNNIDNKDINKSSTEDDITQDDKIENNSDTIIENNQQNNQSSDNISDDNIKNKDNLEEEIIIKENKNENINDNNIQEDKKETIEIEKVDVNENIDSLDKK